MYKHTSRPEIIFHIFGMLIVKACILFSSNNQFRRTIQSHINEINSDHLTKSHDK